MFEHSRIRSHSSTFFDVFYELALFDNMPTVIRKYPEDYCDEIMEKSVLKFAFPVPAAHILSNETVQSFSFVLTDSQSQHTFGFFRSLPKTKTFIVMLSAYPFLSMFPKVLHHLSCAFNEGTESDLERMLTHMYHLEMPQAGRSLRIPAPANKKELELTIPDLKALPTMQENKYMLEFYNALNESQIVALFCSMLRERRILFVGSKLSQLSSCVLAASTLLFPMAWQHLIIPVVPESLLDMLQAPMPFLMGVPKSLVNDEMLSEIGHCITIDLDEQLLNGSIDDSQDVPSNVLASLRADLKNCTGMGDAFSRVFLRAMVNLFGSYRLGFSRSEDSGIIAWNREKFVTEQPENNQTFLESLVGSEGVQYFERFIEDRTRMMQAGDSINDEFEEEIRNSKNKNRSQIKVNAQEMLGAIKDSVSSIKLKEKLTKITPKGKNKAQRLHDNVDNITSIENPLHVEDDDDFCKDSEDANNTSQTNCDKNSINLINFDEIDPFDSPFSQPTYGVSDSVLPSSTKQTISADPVYLTSKFTTWTPFPQPSNAQNFPNIMQKPHPYTKSGDRSLPSGIEKASSSVNGRNEWERFD